MPDIVYMHSFLLELRHKSLPTCYCRSHGVEYIDQLTCTFKFPVSLCLPVFNDTEGFIIDISRFSTTAYKLVLFNSAPQISHLNVETFAGAFLPRDIILLVKLRYFKANMLFNLYFEIVLTNTVIYLSYYWFFVDFSGVLGLSLFWIKPLNMSVYVVYVNANGKTSVSFVLFRRNLK